MANNNQTDFITHLDEYIKQILKDKYGDLYPEIIDYEMKQLTTSLNNRFVEKYGYTLDEFNHSLFSQHIFLDLTPNGYVYGNDIKQTWEWAVAVVTNDTEKQVSLLKNQEIETAKNKAKYILHNLELLCNTSLMSKHSKASMRRASLETYNIGPPNPKTICGYDWL